MLNIYEKMVFLSKESEKEWEEMPDSVRNTALHILKQNIEETQWKIQQEMEANVMDESDNKCIEFWRKKANEYEWLYKEQKDITKGYKEIVEEYKREYLRMSDENLRLMNKLIKQPIL
jgi:hypothetical protein